MITSNKSIARIVNRRLHNRHTAGGRLEATVSGDRVAFTENYRVLATPRGLPSRFSLTGLLLKRLEKKLIGYINDGETVSFLRHVIIKRDRTATHKQFQERLAEFRKHKQQKVDLLSEQFKEQLKHESDKQGWFSRKTYY